MYIGTEVQDENSADTANARQLPRSKKAGTTERPCFSCRYSRGKRLRAPGRRAPRTSSRPDRPLAALPADRRSAATCETPKISCAAETEVQIPDVDL